MAKYRAYCSVFVNLAMIVSVSLFLLHLSSSRCFGIILSYRNTIRTLMFLNCQTVLAHSPKPRAAIRMERMCVWAGMKNVGQAARTLNKRYKNLLGPK